ncbi:hypothetical protein F2Q68_00016829 [Brassica cretica]|uniref:Uncharacterized protein n=1 Tax=Brassica cretica TaxID=69181 RepID=A0A8S9HK64_BRACR|nr:hypothetical protein F2Q68_00016829 [Brassica cretica]
MHKNSNNNNNLPPLTCLDYLSLDLRSQLSRVDLSKVSIDDSIGMSIDTPFRPSIDMSIDNPSSELYRAVGHKLHSAHILTSLSIDTNSVLSIDSPSSPRQLPLARQTDHSSKVSIDTPFRPSIDTTTKLSIDNPSSELYRAVGHKLRSAHILTSPSIDTNAVLSIDSPSSPRQLPLARQTYHSSTSDASVQFCTSKGSKITVFLQNVPEPDLKKNLWVPDMISGSKGEAPGSPTASGSQT